MSAGNTANILLIIAAENQAGKIIEEVKQQVGAAAQGIAQETGNARAGFVSYTDAIARARQELAEHGRITTSTKEALGSFRQEQRLVTQQARENHEMMQSVGKVFSDVGAIAQRVQGMFMAYNVAQIRVEETSERVERAQDKLNKAIAEHGPRSAEATKATEQLKDAQKDLAQAEQASTMQLVNMAFQIPSFLGQFSNLQQNVDIMRFKWQQHRIENTLAAGQLAATPAPAAAAGAGLTTTGTGAHFAAGGFKALFLAMGPVGWAMMGLSTVMILVATNTFGLGDKLGELAKMLGIGVPSAAAETAQALDPGVTAAAEQVQAEVDTLNAQQLPELDANLKKIKIGADTLVLTLEKEAQTIRLNYAETQVYQRVLENLARAGYEPAKAQALALKAAQEGLHSVLRTGKKDIEDATVAIKDLTLAEERSALASARKAELGIQGASGIFTKGGTQITTGAGFTKSREQLPVLDVFQQAALKVFGDMRPAEAIHSPLFQRAAGSASRIALQNLAREHGINVEAIAESVNAVARARVGPWAGGRGTVDPTGIDYALRAALLEKGVRTTFGEFVSGVPAQHGFSGMVDRPTLFMAGEAGPEHVRVTPGGRSENITITIVDEGGNLLGSSTLDRANREGTIRLKTRIPRLY